MWAETSAPKREIELLLADAPQEAPQAARAATAQAIDDAEELVGGIFGLSNFFHGASGVPWTCCLARYGRCSCCKQCATGSAVRCSSSLRTDVHSLQGWC